MNVNVTETEVTPLVEQANAWVMSTKKSGDRIGAWTVADMDRASFRELEVCERCNVTSFCYPVGVILVKAKLTRLAVSEQTSLH